jgi:hypothetical protein
VAERTSPIVFHPYRHGSSWRIAIVLQRADVVGDFRVEGVRAPGTTLGLEELTMDKLVPQIINDGVTDLAPFYLIQLESR